MSKPWLLGTNHFRTPPYIKFHYHVIPSRHVTSPTVVYTSPLQKTTCKAAP